MVNVLAALGLIVLLGFIFSWILFGDRKDNDFQDLDY